MKIKHVLESRYAVSKKLPVKLVRIFKAYFDEDGEFEEDSWSTWYPKQGLTVRYDKSEHERQNYDNRVGGISGPNERGQFDVHDTHSGDGPIATSNELVKNLYFEHTREV